MARRSTDRADPILEVIYRVNASQSVLRRAMSSSR